MSEILKVGLQRHEARPENHFFHRAAEMLSCREPEKVLFRLRSNFSFQAKRNPEKCSLYAEISVVSV